jgi:hypothetical protein
MRQAGFAPVAAMQSSSRIAGKELFTKHQIRFRSLDTQLTQVGDTAVEAVMINSHDGTSKYVINLGAFRLACLNGMVVSEGLIQSVRVQHSGNIIEQVVESTRTLIQMAPRVTDAIRQWKQIFLSGDEQLILAESALALRFEDQAPVTADRLLTVRRNADNSNDLWSVFNRIQEATVRGGLKYLAPTEQAPSRLSALTTVNDAGVTVEARRNRTREVHGIDQNTRLNRELWSLAEKMAALKS